MDNKYEIQKVLVISTAHISINEMHQIEKNQFRYVTMNYPEGAFVYLDDDDDEGNQPISEEFTKIRTLARNLGCTVIRLDCDGLIYDEFKTFEWEREYKGATFDDFVEEEGKTVWSQVCGKCIEMHCWENESITEVANDCICGVKGCNNTADYYIDFK